MSGIGSYTIVIISVIIIYCLTFNAPRYIFFNDKIIQKLRNGTDFSSRVVQEITIGYSTYDVTEITNAQSSYKLK